MYAHNPRDSFIAIKIAGERPRVKTRAGLDQLETRLTAKGVTKVTTNQGIIYRLPR